MNGKPIFNKVLSMSDYSVRKWKYMDNIGSTSFNTITGTKEAILMIMVRNSVLDRNTLISDYYFSDNSLDQVGIEY